MPPEQSVAYFPVRSIFLILSLTNVRPVTDLIYKEALCIEWIWPMLLTHPVQAAREKNSSRVAGKTS